MMTAAACHAIITDENESEPIFSRDPAGQLLEQKKITSCSQLTQLKNKERNLEQTEIKIINGSAKNKNFSLVTRQGDQLIIKNKRLNDTLKDFCDEFKLDYFYYILEGVYWPAADTSSWVLKTVSQDDSLYTLIDENNRRYQLPALPVFNNDHKKFVLASQKINREMLDTVIQIFEYNPQAGWQKEFQASYSAPCDECRARALKAIQLRWLQPEEIQISLNRKTPADDGSLESYETRLVHQYERWYLK